MKHLQDNHRLAVNGEDDPIILMQKVADSNPSNPIHLLHMTGSGLEL
jgi:hypothetical protein